MHAAGSGIHAVPAKGLVSNPLLYVACITPRGPVYIVGWYLRETKTLLYLTAIMEPGGEAYPIRIRKATMHSTVKLQLGEGLSPKFADA